MHTGLHNACELLLLFPVKFLKDTSVDPYSFSGIILGLLIGRGQIGKVHHKMDSGDTGMSDTSLLFTLQKICFIWGP